MAQGRITDKQKEILEFIKACILKKGYPPTVREICEKVQLKSTSSVHSHLEQLEKNGYIHRDPTKPRAIEIVDDTFNLSRRELVNVPLIGTVAAGAPILADENVENYFPIPAELLPNSETFMLKVRGNSMIDVGMARSWLHSSMIQLPLSVSSRRTVTIVSSRRMQPWIRLLWIKYRFLAK